MWQARDNDDDGRLDDIFETLHECHDDDAARDRLIGDFGLEADTALALMRLPMADGTASVSRRFMASVVPVLRDQGLKYYEAVTQLSDDKGNPLHHSMRDDGRRWTRLPYYGEVLSQSMLGADPTADAATDPERHFGRINNPTVHVALNRLRKLVNTLSERFGAAPLQVHVELTRDLKLPRQVRDEISKRQAANERENERLRKEFNMPDMSGRDLKKVKLWEELGENQLARQCIFSGQTISKAQLINGEAEIEHLLPFSRTLDDSMANLTVAMRWANRLKGNNTPFEAFRDDLQAERGIVWQEVLARAQVLPENKRRRFGPDALARYEEDGGFIARQLSDTAYMSRAATRYLAALEGIDQVMPNPGRLTALVRGKWGFNGILSDDNMKTREDHRHHAVDAAVIGLTDRAVLNEVSRLTARGADDLGPRAAGEIRRPGKHGSPSRAPLLARPHW